MNTNQIIGLVVILLVAAFVAAASGCDVGELIKVNTPREVAQERAIPTRTTLNDGWSEYQAWRDDVERIDGDWRATLERGDEVAGIFRAAALQGLDALGPSISGIPVLAPAAPLLTGLAGLVFGTMRTRREKEASFRKGQETAIELVKRGTP